MRGVTRKWTCQVESSAAARARKCRRLRARRARAPGPRSGTAPAAVPGLVEQLTSRELEVLGMLAAAEPNQAIADQLVVTLDTVEKRQFAAR